ncbi:MAG: protein kinase, partial [Verrucomicrobiales bacterium]|nr:protein kinase [Verrucomicrobiales bacterium]
MDTTHDASREREIFLQAIELEPVEARRDYLERACEGNPQRLMRLEALLKSHEDATRFLDDTPSIPVEPPGERPGMRIGRYKLLEQIGEGGCGVVFMAEQEEPVRRRVALKVIKIGMDTRAIVTRFEAERQALAMMDHPSIAKVFDAGATELGRPYFVMELVRGVPLTRFCDEHQLDLRQRLELFVQVCQAVQHAHQKGVIHRDLKPSNVLVSMHDDRPVPKVIDFGIAKATEGRLTDRTHFTFFDQFVGTPAYMSPEQAGMSGLDVDTRSDIYTLGVLLYELLTGVTPFDAQELLAVGWEAMRQAIREKDPVRPSTRLTQLQVAQAGSTRETRARTAAVLATDLDWIVMKCLEKDRTRRYETANGLAADLQRHLANEPVIARPPSFGYQLQKAIRRHRVAFGAGALVALSLVVGLTLAGWMYLKQRRALEKEAAALVEARRERDRADGAARESEVARNLAAQEKRQAEANLVRVREADGWRRVREGDYFGALGAFAEALRLEKDDPDRAALHRQRLASTYARCPRLVNVWSTGSNMTWVAFSSDGSRLLSANTLSPTQAVARIRDASTGRDLVAPMEHRGPIATAYWSRDESRVVTASLDGTARVWDAETGKPVSPPLIHQGPVSYANLDSKGTRVVSRSLEQSPEGPELLVVSMWESAMGLLRWKRGMENEMENSPFVFVGGDREIVGMSQRFDTQTGEEAGYTPLQSCCTRVGVVVSQSGLPHENTIASEDLVAKADEGRVVASLSGDRVFLNHPYRDPEGSVLIDTTNAFAVLASWRGTTVPQRGLFNNKGSLIATATGDGSVQVWNAEDGQLRDLGTRTSVAGPVTAMAFGPGDGSLVLGTSEGTVKVLDLVDWNTFGELALNPPLPHKTSIAAAVIQDGTGRVIVACADGSVAEWQILVHEEIPEWTLRCSKDIGHIRLSSTERYLMGWMSNRPEGWYPEGYAESFSLASIWELETGSQLRWWLPTRKRWSDEQLEVAGDGTLIRRMGDQVEAIAPGGGSSMSFSLDDDSRTNSMVREFVTQREIIACGYQGGTEVRIYDLRTGQITGRIVTEAPIVDAFLSPKVSTLLTIETNQLARLWSVGTRQPLSQAKLPDNTRILATLGEEGVRLMLRHEDSNAIELWDAQLNRRLLGPLAAPWLAVSEQFRSISPNLLSCCYLSLGRLVLARTLEPEVIRVVDHPGVVCWAFSPDSQLLATASTDGKVRFWDTRTADEALPAVSVPASPGQLVFTPDSHKLIVRGLGVVFVWDLERGERSTEDWLLIAEFFSLAPGGQGGRSMVVDQTMARRWEEVRLKLEEGRLDRSKDSRAQLQMDAWMAEEGGRWETASETLSRLVSYNAFDLGTRERRAAAAVKVARELNGRSELSSWVKGQLELAMGDIDFIDAHAQLAAGDVSDFRRNLARNRVVSLTLLGRQEEAEKLQFEVLGIPALSFDRDPRWVDLGPWYNAPLPNFGSWRTEVETIDGVVFDLRGQIRLASGHLDQSEEVERTIRGIPIHRTFNRAHLLVNARVLNGEYPGDRTLVAKLVFRYSDGQTNSLDLRIGDDFREQVRVEKGTPQARFGKPIFSWPV